MKKTTLTIVFITCFLFINMNRMEGRENEEQIKAFIEKFEDEFKEKNSSDGDYIRNVYYNDGYSKINKVSTKLDSLEIIRIGKGYKSTRVVEYMAQIAEHPEARETVFYFVDGKLFCTQTYKLTTDFNSVPSTYATAIFFDKYYSENDTYTEHIRYRCSDSNIGQITSKNLSDKQKIDEKSIYIGESNTVEKAYNWLNKNNDELNDEALKDLIDVFEKELNDSIYLSTNKNSSVKFALNRIPQTHSRFITCYKKNKTIKNSKTFGNIEITRIGRGSFKNITTKISSNYTTKKEITYPQFSETVYYFMNDKLFKAKKLISGTDYNFNPAAFWINIYTTEYYFKNDKQTEYKNYFQFGMVASLNGEKKEVENDYKLFGDIDPIEEAYKLLNSD